MMLISTESVANKHYLAHVSLAKNTLLHQMQTATFVQIYSSLLLLNTHYLSFPGMLRPSSPCSGGGLPPPGPPVPPGRCPLPWVRPATRFYFDGAQGGCRPFLHPGCNLNGNGGGEQNNFNQFA